MLEGYGEAILVMAGATVTVCAMAGNLTAAWPACPPAG